VDLLLTQVLVETNIIMAATAVTTPVEVEVAPTETRVQVGLESL
jgi:hypothetical protein